MRPYFAAAKKRRRDSKVQPTTGNTYTFPQYISPTVVAKTPLKYSKSIRVNNNI